MIYSPPPKILPPSITAAQPQLQLFVSYVLNPPMKNALYRVVKRTEKQELQDALAAVHEAGIPRDHESLCRLVTCAPQVAFLVRQSVLVSQEIIGPEGIPSDELIAELVAAYHRWIRHAAS